MEQDLTEDVFMKSRKDNVDFVGRDVVSPTVNSSIINGLVRSNNPKSSLRLRRS